MSKNNDFAHLICIGSFFKDKSIKIYDINDQ
jgi:hypothetical protein